MNDQDQALEILADALAEATARREREITRRLLSAASLAAFVGATVLLFLAAVLN